jgi:glycosyltransferase involved in cell wall biosynthesis
MTQVLHLIPSVSPVRGGPSEAVLSMSAALRARGFESEIIATNDDGPGTLDVPCGEWTTFRGERVRFFPRWSPPVRALREFGYAPGLTRWLREHAKEYDVAQAHGLFSYATSFGMRAVRQAGVPYISRPLGVLCRWSLQQSPRRKQLFLAAVDRANLDGSAAIHCTAAMEAEEIGDLGLRAPLFVAPLGVDASEAPAGTKAEMKRALGLEPNRPLILFLSRWHHKKGIEALLGAAAHLPRGSFTLAIAGGGEPGYEASIRQLAGELGLAAAIFPGFVKGTTKWTWLKAADLFALPSLSENFGIAVAEAMAVGAAPLVGPGVALSREVVTANCGWVAEPTADAVAAALTEALANPEECRVRGERAVAFAAAHLTWGSLAERLADVYGAILSRQPIPHQPGPAAKQP